MLRVQLALTIQVPEALIPLAGARVMSLTDGLSKVINSTVSLDVP